MKGHCHGPSCAWGRKPLRAKLLSQTLRSDNAGSHLRSAAIIEAVEGVYLETRLSVLLLRHLWRRTRGSQDLDPDAQGAERRRDRPQESASEHSQGEVQRSAFAAFGFWPDRARNLKLRVLAFPHASVSFAPHDCVLFHEHCHCC